MSILHGHWLKNASLLDHLVKQKTEERECKVEA
jgi:hypothetical protein